MRADLTARLSWFHFTSAACATRDPTVPIQPFLDRDNSFGPEDIVKLSAAFEAALGKLGLVDRTDPEAVGRQTDY